MRMLIGLVLALIGAGLILYGIATGFSTLVGLYQGALADALNQPEGTEKHASDAMWRSAMIGAAGLPPFLIGSVLLKLGAIGRLLGKK